MYLFTASTIAVSAICILLLLAVKSHDSMTRIRRPRLSRVAYTGALLVQISILLILMQTKQKYIQRFRYFLDFAKVGTEKEKISSIEERCNILAELAKSDHKWLVSCIFNYLQFLKTRVDSKEIKALHLETISSLLSYFLSK